MWKTVWIVEDRQIVTMAALAAFGNPFAEARRKQAAD